MVLLSLLNESGHKKTCLQARSHTEQVVQPQWDSTIYVAKTKVLISLIVNVQLISVFDFEYAYGRFSHDVTRFRVVNTSQ